MKKITTTLICISAFIIANAQINQCTIQYNCHGNFNTQAKQGKVSDTSEMDAPKFIADFNIPTQHILYFSKGKSLYQPYIQPANQSKGQSYQMPSDGNDFIVKMMGKTKQYYFDTKNKIVLNTIDFLDKPFTVSDPKIDDMKWLQIDSTKEIIGFKCKLAYFVSVMFNDAFGTKGYHLDSTFAWYTNSLPVNLGPENYRGLKGTILQLKNKNYTIEATAFQASVDETKLVKPNKGKLVSQEELWKEQDRFMNSNNKIFVPKDKSTKAPNEIEHEEWEKAHQ